jgi:23S rRNA pseudouridine2605 synthase
VQKKFPEDSSKPKRGKPPIPFKGKKKKPAIAEVARKYFEKKSAEFKKEGKSLTKEPNKPVKEFKGKKEGIPGDTTNGIYSPEQVASDETRLNKYLAHAGIASRRSADELIKEGRVKVNGVVVTEMGHKVKLHDKVEFDDKLLSLEKKYYILLNKPKDFITTVNDEKNRRTVMELLRSAYLQIKSPAKPRLYPVGRLDRNTTGVLLITNDGELAQKLTHPSSEIRKVYHVVLNKKLRKDDFNKIAEGGVVLEDGIAEVDEIAYPNPKNLAEVGIEIHTGKNRFIRRLFESLDYEVEKLDRVYFAGLTKKDLARGRWRFLNESEVRLLKHFV